MTVVGPVPARGEWLGAVPKPGDWGLSPSFGLVANRLLFRNGLVLL